MSRIAALRFGLAFGLVASAGPLWAATLDFEAGGPCLFEETTPLTDLYSGLGVTFSGVDGAGGSILNQCSNFGIDARSGTDFLAFNSGVTGEIERIDFASTTGSVSLYAGSFEGVTFELLAYDALGVLLDFDTATPGFGEYGFLSVAAPGIAYVLFTGGFGSYVVDDLTFAAIPEPASWALMIIGFGAVGFAVRRTRVAVAA